MTEILFEIVTYAGAPLWALMIFAPHWTGTRRVIGSPYLLLPWVGLYAVLVVPGLPQFLPLILQPKLDAIAALLATPEGALIGWIHFVAFDLFVGRWIYLDSRERGTSAWLVSPVLFVTLLFGPLGLTVYLLLRLAVRPTERSPQ
jgi:hypothetical protein